MPSVRAAQIETYYQDIGRHEKTLLLLHGWGNSWEAWSPLIPHLAAKYRLIIPDLPGFGQTASPDKGWTTHDYVHWLKAFLHALRVQELEAVVGHSYGGKISAFAWLSQSSDLPLPKNGLFLIGPSGIPTPLSPARRFLAKALPLIPVSVRRGALAPLRRFLYLTLLNERDYLSASPYQEETLRQILPEDIRDHVKEQSPVRVRFCWGEYDGEMPLWMAYQFAQMSKDAHVFAVRNTGHFPHHTHPHLVHQWLESWL